MSKELESASVKVVEVTPALAQTWLMHNTANRPLKEKTVKLFVKDMQRGKWRLVPDAIAFNTKGLLTNGQHRLNAVIKYGKPVTFLVARGLAPDSFNVTDTGKLRQPGDILAVNGIGNGNKAAAICRGVLIYQKTGSVGTNTNRADGTVNLSNQDILDFAKKNSDMLDEAMAISYNVTKHFKGLATRSIGTLYWILALADKAKAIKFFDLYATGIDLREKHPVALLRQKLIADMGSKKKYPERDKCAWMVIAWNNYVKGKDLTAIRWDSEKSEFPKPI